MIITQLTRGTVTPSVDIEQIVTANPHIAWAALAFTLIMIITHCTKWAMSPPWPRMENEYLTEAKDAPKALQRNIQHHLQERHNVKELTGVLNNTVTEDQAIMAEKERVQRNLDNLIEEAATGSQRMTDEQLETFDAAVAALAIGAQDIRQRAEGDRTRRLDMHKRFARNLYLPSALDSAIKNKQQPKRTPLQKLLQRRKG